MKTSFKSSKLWHLKVGCNFFYVDGNKATNEANVKNTVIEDSFDNGDSWFTGRQQEWLTTRIVLWKLSHKPKELSGRESDPLMLCSH